MNAPDPAFLIVGTPRSGTTLVQRLASEVPGVRVPPETHFFWAFAPRLLRRRRFPLDEHALREELEEYGRLETSREIGLDVDAVVADLGGCCRSIVELFGAVVRQLAGPGRVYGEKTPPHLLWWRPLSTALPALKFVAVVRDPRAVVASTRHVPWSKPYFITAERWRSDQVQVLRALEHLGPGRVLVVRYMDVVRDPDAATERLAAFLSVGAGVAVPEGASPSRLALSWETWKERVYEPITSERIDAWREELEPREAEAIAAICRKEMERFGYGAPRGLEAAAARIRMHPREQAGALRFRLARRRQIARLERIVL